MNDRPLIAHVAIAGLMAWTLAAALRLGVSSLLRWLPNPAGPANENPLSGLHSPGFTIGVFRTTGFLSWLCLSLSDPSDWLVWIALAGPGSLLAWIDMRTCFLPSRLIHLGVAGAIAGAGVASTMARSWLPMIGALTAGGLAIGFFWVFWRFSAGRLGFGDVRLAGLIGISTGAVGLAVPSFLLGTSAAAVWGLILRRRSGADVPFPYGPGLLVGPPLALVSAVLLPG